MAIASAALVLVLGRGHPLGDPLDIASPAFFPFIASLLIGIASLSLTIQAVLSLRPFRPGFPRPWGSPGVLPVMALFVAYALLMPWLGMWLTSAIAVALLAWILGLRRAWLLVLLALVPPYVVIRIFESALNILFPEARLP